MKETAIQTTEQAKYKNGEHHQKVGENHMKTMTDLR